MTSSQETPSPSPSPTITAGELLRGYRLGQNVSLHDLAKVLRVSEVKLLDLEENRWELLHDTMFVRSLSLAVCRQLQSDAAPVLALLPVQDHSKIGDTNPKGLNSPLSRPSFLPQQSFLNWTVFFTPMRWAALGLFILAMTLAIWPEIQHWIVYQDHPAAGISSIPVVLPTETTEGREVNTVITPVQSVAFPAPVPLVPNPVAPASETVTHLPLSVPVGVTYGR
jgi:cytoskeletal protein RodZ